MGWTGFSWFPGLLLGYLSLLSSVFSLRLSLGSLYFALLLVNGVRVLVNSHMTGVMMSFMI